VPTITITRHTPFDSLPELLKIDEVAAFLGCGKTQAYSLVRAGKLPAVCFGNPSSQYPNGKIIRVPRSALLNLTQQQQPELVGAK